MTEFKRKIILDVADGNHDCLRILYSLEQFKKCDQMVFWLFKNEIKGQKLIEVYKSVDSSPLNLANGILKRLEKDKNKKVTIKDLK